ncbi:hypothetical protein [Streptomyces anandii]|uniref:hypothetical protein n=1 Tax=Streptomyces anandii TaxID=285454 RepID=UPI000A54B028|nr:hypothetical protein [Streptomyces anandii]GGX94742.1 hypothetical protein GCM10010510_44970 [Streptomyces anandii JCM 4720]
MAKRQRLLTKALKKALHECVNGCGRGKAGNRYCTDCGTALPIFDGAAKSASAPAFLAKSETPTDPLCFDWGDSTDPAERERAWHEEYNRLISKPAVKSASAPDEPSFWDPNSSDPQLSLSAIHDLSDARYHSDPAVREATWNALNNRSTKGR